LGVTGVALSIAAGIRKYVKEIKECTYHDNTGLLDNYNLSKDSSK